MNMNKDQQQQTTRKKFNQRQYTRKTQHFKKKHQRTRLPTKTKANKRTHNCQQPDTTPLVGHTNLTTSQSSLIKKKCIPLDTEPNTDPTLFLTDYSMISNMTFKQMLLTIPNTHTDTWVQSLNNEEILTLTRQFASLINKLNYLKLQNEQWTYYYHLGMTEGIWNGRVSKTMAIANSMCHTYGRSKFLIEQRRQKYKQQLEQIKCQLNEYMKHTPTVPDANRIMTIVHDLIHNDQYQLRTELERRRHVLKFDATDHQLVQDFYRLNPRQTEVG
jgi:hypothetical protein